MELRIWPAFVVAGIILVTFGIMAIVSCDQSAGTKSYYHPDYAMDDRTHLCFATGPSYTNVPCNPEVLKLAK